MLPITNTIGRTPAVHLTPATTLAIEVPIAFIKHDGKGGIYKRISAAACCKHFQLKYKNTLLFEQIDLDDEGVLMLDLNKAVRVTSGAR